MKRLFSLLAGLLVVGRCGYADEPKLPASLVVPVTAYAKTVRDGDAVFLKLRFVAAVEKTATNTVTKFVTQKLIRDGVETEAQVPVTQTIQTTYKTVGGWREVTLDPSERGVMITTAAGKLIARDDLPKLLKEETPVLVSAGRAADPFYLLTVKENTLVIIAPETVVNPPAPVQGRAAGAPPVVLPRPGASSGSPGAPSVMPPRPGASPGSPGAPAPAAAPFAPGGAFEVTPEEKELCALANAERQKAGVAPLAMSALLFKAARQHSANMARQEMLSHTLDEKGPTERLKDVGYEWSQYGENVALAQRTPADAILSWMNSPQHKENLLSKDSTQIGVAVAAAADGKKYWTMVLATPK